MDDPLPQVVCEKNIDGACPQLWKVWEPIL